MKKIILVLHLIAVMLYCIGMTVYANAEGFSATGLNLYEYTTYCGTTAQKFTVAWDVVENTSYYRVYLNNMERDRRIDMGVVETNQIEIQMPRSGHYTIEVVACIIVEDSDDVCSNSALSTDSSMSTVDSEAKGWWVYSFIAPAGQITIE